MEKIPKEKIYKIHSDSYIVLIAQIILFFLLNFNLYRKTKKIIMIYQPNTTLVAIIVDNILLINNLRSL